MKNSLNKQNNTKLYSEQYAKELMKIYTQHIDADYANWSKKYMRNQFDFLGIRTPLRRKITKQFFKDYGVPSSENLQDVIFILWNLPEREYQKAALDLLEVVKKSLSTEDMSWITSLILQKSWWDTVDVLSPHIAGYLFKSYPILIPQYADQWILDDNIWLQRAAILYQLSYKKSTDEKRLFHYILTRANSREFFVQKAIGWALREYAKTNPSIVKEFVTSSDLQPLSKREALKNLK